jgi:hypothetical protein
MLRTQPFPQPPIALSRRQVVDVPAAIPSITGMFTSIRTAKASRSRFFAIFSGQPAKAGAGPGAWARVASNRANGKVQKWQDQTQTIGYGFSNGLGWTFPATTIRKAAPQQWKAVNSKCLTPT